jgi:hypothetical protein
MIRFGPSIAAIAAVAVSAAIVLTTSERPPMDGIQRGYRGLAMQEVYNPRFVANALAANHIPASLPRLPDAGPKAGAVYKNVQVLGDEGVGNFTRLMASITTWVSPTQGCAYCHNVNDMASDALYIKLVARRMVQMVQHVNSGWQTHVAATGVTCYTCHRGQPVPANVWFHDPGRVRTAGLLGNDAGQNDPIRGSAAGRRLRANAGREEPPDGGGWSDVAAVRSIHPVPGAGHQYPCSIAAGTARHRPPVNQADRLDLCADDEFLAVAWG